MSSPDSFRDIGTLAGGGQPDAPHLPIENLIAQLVEHAADAAAAQERLRLFQRASRILVGELSLQPLLRHLVDLARELVGARYAALGVVDRHGHFGQFLHSGLDADAAAAAGEPPKGRGVLGLLVENPVATRLPAVGDDPHACGFPVGHPPVETLLGVPVRCRDGLYAVLYVADRDGGRPFTAQDEDLAQALAVTAGIAIDNARVHEDSRRRQEWLRAAGSLSQHTVGRAEERMVLQRTVEIVLGLLDADTVALLTPDEDGGRLAVVAAAGAGAGDVLGVELDTQDSVTWRAMCFGQGLALDLERADEHRGEAELQAVLPMGPTLVLPLPGECRARGAVLAVRRPRRAAFSQAELDLAETFAAQSAVALQLAATRSANQRLSGLEQRDHIARDLNEHVVQRLFAVRARVQDTVADVPDPLLRRRLLRHVDEVDATITQIRTSIFTLTEPGPAGRTLRETVRAVVDELVPVLGLQPELRLHGPLDWTANTPLLRDVEAVLRESLTNVSKYAGATGVEVGVETDGSRLEVTITDNGVGLTGSTRRSGLDNLRRRAERYGGRLTIDNRTEGGLRLLWAIPL